MNYMMGNNATLPQVGAGCTMLSWTDRHAYEVISASEDKKRVVIQQYQPVRTDNNGMSETQNYAYTILNGFNEIIVWKWGAWRKEVSKIMFTEEYAKTIGPKWFDSDDHKLLYPNDGVELTVVIPGKTEIRKQYSKVNILWGVKDEYHDYSF